MLKKIDGALELLYRFYARNRFWLLLAALAILGILSARILLQNSASNGIGLRSDSLRYIWTAENFANGLGLSRLNGDKLVKPTTHWPPLYPIALAAFIKTGLNGLEAARWFASLAVGMLVISSGLYIYRLTNRSLWFAIIGAGLLVSMPHFWETNLFAMTEAIFLVWCFLALLFTDIYTTNHKGRWLVASAVMQAFAFLTRYVGGALLAVCALMLILDPGSGWKKKFKDIFVMGILAVLPMIAWMVRNELVAEAATNRTLAFNAIAVQEWSGLYTAIKDWMWPFTDLITLTPARPFLLALAGLAASSFIFWYSRQETRQTASRLWISTAIFGGAYLAMTIAARLLFDRDIPLYEQRILLPFFAALYMLVLFGLHRLLEFSRRFGTLPPVILTCLMLVLAWGIGRGYYKQTAPLLAESAKTGLGVANNSMQRLPFIPLVNELPYEYTYFTDDLDRMYYLFGKPAFQINYSNPPELEKLTERLEDQKIVIVLFSPDNEVEILDKIPELHKLYFEQDGAVYSNFKHP